MYNGLRLDIFLIIYMPEIILCRFMHKKRKYVPIFQITSFQMAQKTENIIRDGQKKYCENLASKLKLIFQKSIRSSDVPRQHQSHLIHAYGSTGRYSVPSECCQVRCLNPYLPPRQLPIPNAVYRIKLWGNGDPRLTPRLV